MPSSRFVCLKRQDEDVLNLLRLQRLQRIVLCPVDHQRVLVDRLVHPVASLLRLLVLPHAYLIATIPCMIHVGQQQHGRIIQGVSAVIEDRVYGQLPGLVTASTSPYPR